MDADAERGVADVPSQYGSTEVTHIMYCLLVMTTGGSHEKMRKSISRDYADETR
jgi:hypothetical protein